MKSKYKAVFLDFDGTIANTAPGIYESLDYACDCLNKPRLDKETKKLFIGPPLFQSFTKLIGCNEEEANFGIQKYREKYIDGAMLKLDVYDGIQELFCQLHDNRIKTAVCSSKPEIFVKRIIESLGFADKIDFISCPYGDNPDKTKKDLINDALQFFNVSPKEAVMVGDTKYDIEGAKEANVLSIGVAYGYGGEVEMKNCKADYIAYTVNDVKKFVFSEENI